MRWSYLCIFSIFISVLFGAQPLTEPSPDDEYLTGYVQALVDAYYSELYVRVVVKNHVASICNLPANPLIAEAIVCFVKDIPGICSVEKASCCQEKFKKYHRSCSCSSSCSHPTACHVCSPCSLLRGMWFPQFRVLFTPLLADPRQVKNSAEFRFGDSVIGQKVGAVSFGDIFPIYRRCHCGQWNGDIEFNIEAGIFAVFNLENLENSYVNCDYFVAGASSYAVDKGVWRLRVWHQSSHLGDEFLLTHPKIERKNPSDNAVDLFYSYQYSKSVRLYGGLAYLFFRDRSFDGGRIFVDFGTEVRFCRFFNPCFRLYSQPYFGMHFHFVDESQWNLDETYVLGLECSGIQGVGRKCRIYGMYHNGFSREGQFVRKKSSYASFVVSYSF